MEVVEEDVGKIKLMIATTRPIECNNWMSVSYDFIEIARLT